MTGNTIFEQTPAFSKWSQFYSEISLKLTSSKNEITQTNDSLTGQSFQKGL